MVILGTQTRSSSSFQLSLSMRDSSPFSGFPFPLPWRAAAAAATSAHRPPPTSPPPSAHTRPSFFKNAVAVPLRRLNAAVLPLLSFICRCYPFVPTHRLTTALRLGSSPSSLFEDRRTQIYRSYPPFSQPLLLTPFHLLSPRVSIKSLLRAADLREGYILLEKEGIWQWDPGIEIAGGCGFSIALPVKLIHDVRYKSSCCLFGRCQKDDECWISAIDDRSFVKSGHWGVKNLKDAVSSIPFFTTQKTKEIESDLEIHGYLLVSFVLFRIDVYFLFLLADVLRYVRFYLSCNFCCCSWLDSMNESCLVSQKKYQQINLSSSYIHNT